MGKSILLLDSVDTCAECPMCYEAEMLPLGNYEYRKLFSCRCIPEDVEDIYIDRILSMKPDLCPLKEVPSKMAEENRWFSEEYAEGWNACIDEITGG